MIRILIADDQLLFAENLKIMLETLTDDMRIVGIASDGAQAIDMANAMQPDIILMDIRMPNVDGLNATKSILSRNRKQKIVIMTTFQEEHYVSTTLHSGAVGYLLKSMKSRDLIAALRAVNEGMVLLSPQVIDSLIKLDHDPIDEEALQRYQQLFDSFSRREKNVLRLVANGYSNQRIAQELFLAEATVRNYISTIYTKLGTNDRLEVIEYAKQHFSSFFSEDGKAD